MIGAEQAYAFNPPAEANRLLSSPILPRMRASGRFRVSGLSLHASAIAGEYALSRDRNGSQLATSSAVRGTARPHGRTPSPELGAREEERVTMRQLIEQGSRPRRG